MTLHAPQIIVLTLMLLALGIDAAQHGTPKTGEENFWRSLISTALTVALLWWGGFFSQ